MFRWFVTREIKDSQSTDGYKILFGRTIIILQVPARFCLKTSSQKLQSPCPPAPETDALTRAGQGQQLPARGEGGAWNPKIKKYLPSFFKIKHKYLTTWLNSRGPIRSKWICKITLGHHYYGENKREFYCATNLLFSFIFIKQLYFTIVLILFKQGDSEWCKTKQLVQVDLG